MKPVRPKPICLDLQAVISGGPWWPVAAAAAAAAALACLAANNISFVGLICDFVIMGQLNCLRSDCAEGVRLEH